VLEPVELLKWSWSLVMALFWYDKRRSDKRIDDLERRVNTNDTATQLLAKDIESLKELFEVKSDHMQSTLDEIKDKIIQQP